MERDFNEDALLRAEVRLSRTGAEFLSSSLRRAVRRDLAAAHERGDGQGGPSPETLRAVEAAAAALEGATLLEAAKRSEEVWTGERELDGRRAAEEERRAEEEARRELGEGRYERRVLLERVVEGVREGRTDFSAEEVGLMREMLRIGEPSSSERVEGFLGEGGRLGKNN